MSKINGTDSTLANKLRFVPNKKTYFPRFCATMCPGVGKLKTMFGKSKSTILKASIISKTCCTVVHCHVGTSWRTSSSALPERAKHPLRTPSREWGGYNKLHIHILAAPTCRQWFLSSKNSRGRDMSFFCNDPATFGSDADEVQNIPKPKPCRQQLRVKNLQQRGLRHTTRSNRHLCPNIELVTSFLNCCLEAKGMSQYTDPFVAHPFLAEHRRHQKKHCQVSATKSCMASFSQGRCVEHLGSRKSPTSLAAKGFIYCSSMSGAWTDMPIAHDNIM